MRSPPLTIQVSSASIAAAVRRRRIERQAHHRFVIAHQRDRLVGRSPPGGVDAEFDRAEAVAAAIDQVAEQHDDAPRGAARLTRRLVEQRFEQVAAAMDVADCEDFSCRRRARAAAHIASGQF